MFLCSVNKNYPLLSSNTPSYQELCQYIFGPYEKAGSHKSSSLEIKALQALHDAPPLRLYQAK